MDRIGDEVRRTLGRTGGGQGLALGEITRAWPAVVGEAIARNAWPQRLGRDGTLHVATSSSTWAFELDRMSAELGERLGAALGEHAPAALRFRPGPLPEPGAAREPEAPPTGVEISPEIASAAARTAAEIEDPDLREIVARAARASLHKRVSEPGSDRGFW